MDQSLILEAPSRFPTDALEAPFGSPPPSDRQPSDRQPSDQQGLDLDVRSVLGALYRNRFLILTIVALSLIAGTASLVLMPHIYRARASIQVDQQTTRVLGTEDAEPSVSGTEADRFLQTQVDVLKSRALAQRVAHDLNLTGARAASFIEKTSGRAVKADAPSLTNVAVGILLNNLSVNLPRNSRVVGIEYDSRDADIAAQVANSYVRSFITGNLQRKVSTSSYSLTFLEGRLAQTKARLEHSERALNAYARGTRLVDTSSVPAGTNSQTASGASLSLSNLVAVNNAYAAARVNRIRLEQRWNEARSTPPMSLPDVLQNSAIQQLLRLRAERQSNVELLRQRFKPDHPQLLQAQAELSEINSQLSSIASGIRNTVRDDYLTARRQEDQLSSNVSQLTSDNLNERDRGIQFNILKREADTNRQLYDGLLQRYKELSAASGIASNNISVVDDAEAPTAPISPLPKRNMAIALALGVLLALIVTFAREMLDDVVRAPDDVERKLGLPVLGVTSATVGSLDTALADPTSPLSEAYASARTALELSTEFGAASPLLLTSSRAKEGKSTSAVALARSFAASNRRTLLIDADLRRPSLHHMLALANDHGLANILARQDPDERAIQSLSDTLDVVTSGPLPPNPAQLLAGSSLPQFLDRCAERYEMVIVDGPPVAGIADALRLSAVVRGTLFIVAANGAHRGAAKAALRRLSEVRAPLLGAVLTKFDPRQAGVSQTPDYYYGYDPQPRRA